MNIVEDSYILKAGLTSEPSWSEPSWLVKIAWSGCLVSIVEGIWGRMMGKKYSDHMCFPLKQRENKVPFDFWWILGKYALMFCWMNYHMISASQILKDTHFLSFLTKQRCRSSHRSYRWSKSMYVTVTWQ